MARCFRQPIIPPCWQEMTDNVDYWAIGRRFPDGLAVVYSVEVYVEGDLDIPPMGYGTYSHISLSRHNKYPRWDEMKEYIYSCDWFDHDRDVVMILPPKEQYVNVHENAFHFYQKIIV